MSEKSGYGYGGYEAKIAAIKAANALHAQLEADREDPDFDRQRNLVPTGNHGSGFPEAPETDWDATDAPKASRGDFLIGGYVAPVVEVTGVDRVAEKPGYSYSTDSVTQPDGKTGYGYTLEPRQSQPDL